MAILENRYKESGALRYPFSEELLALRKVLVFLKAQGAKTDALSPLRLGRDEGWARLGGLPRDGRALGLLRLGTKGDDGVFALGTYAVLAAPDADAARDVVLRGAAAVVAV